MRISTFVLVLLLLAPAVTAQVRTPSPAHQAGDKTMIHSGWSSPSVDQLLDYAASWQGRPFDGLMFHFGDGRQIEAVDLGAVGQPLLTFSSIPWDPADFQFDRLGDIDWGQYTENFVYQQGTGIEGFGWYDDALWSTVLSNARLLSRGIALSEARGVWFDPEFYGFSDFSPWVYSAELYPGRSFADVQAQVQARGASYVQALQTERDAFVFLSLWGFGIAYAQAQVDGTLETVQYALLPSFLGGMIEAAAPGFTLIDGNEGTYYLDETSLVTDNYDFVRYESAAVIPPEVRDAFQREHQVGYALYPDYLFELSGLYAWGHPADFQRDWAEHNTYHALLTTDEFVWVYDELANWWAEPGNPPWQERIPDGLEEAIASARAKYAARAALGFDLAKPGAFWFDPTVAADRVGSPEATLVIAPGLIQPGQSFTVGVDVDGPASAVAVFANGAFVGADTSAPFEVEVAGLPPGKVTVWARAQTGPYQHVTTAPVTRPVRPSVGVPVGPGVVGAATEVFPNPARSAATVRYGLATAGRVRLDALDALGRTVAVLVDEVQAAGSYAERVPLGRVPAGVYLVRLRTDDRTETRRLTVVR